MASIGQIRGALLEEIILFLLSRSGYRMVILPADGARSGRAGLEVRGRGQWHQIDALVTPEYSLPFMYPLRLMVEAKCYDQSRKVDIRVVRAAVGTALDINQSYSRDPQGNIDIELRQFNYHGAIFSTSGYTKEAQQLAAAHQVFLIEYTDVPAMKPIVDALMILSTADFNAREDADIPISLKSLRRHFREAMFREPSSPSSNPFEQWASANAKLLALISLGQGIVGTYYGMIQGLYPVHFVSSKLIVRQMFDSWEIPVRLRVSGNGREWFFEPSHHRADSDLYFKLEFQLPTTIADILQRRADNERIASSAWESLVRLKRDYFSYVDIGGTVDGRFAFFRLTLDQDWLKEYVERRRQTDADTYL